MSVLESLEVSSVSTKSIGASQVARAVSMSPALLGFTEIIRTLQIVFKVAPDSLDFTRFEFGFKNSFRGNSLYIFELTFLLMLPQFLFVLGISRCVFIRLQYTLDLLAPDPFKIMLSKGGSLWKL